MPIGSGMPIQGSDDYSFQVKKKKKKKDMSEEEKMRLKAIKEKLSYGKKTKGYA